MAKRLLSHRAVTLFGPFVRAATGSRLADLREEVASRDICALQHLPSELADAFSL